MIEKTKERKKAIRLRKKGYSYSEILQEIPIARSTLSLWLRDVKLTKQQRQRLTEKKLLAQRKGARIRREQRIRLTKIIKSKARKEVGEKIGEIGERELWLIGVILYWAEGTKQKETNPSQKVRFGNSDPLMVKIFLKWILEVCRVPLRELDFEIYIHETGDIKKAREYWCHVLNLPQERIQKIRLKRHKVRTKRKNIGKDY